MEVLLSEAKIQARVGELAKQIVGDYQEQPVTIVGVLTGSLMFLADLVRRLDLRLRIGLIQASSYRGDSTVPGQLIVQSDFRFDVKGRHVLLLDDILDSGQTVSTLVAQLEKMGASSIRVAVLLRKRGRQTIPFEPDYCGFEIPDVFVVGYGLDYNDEYRHLPFVGVLPSPSE